jgi:hypothetical protein
LTWLLLFEHSAIVVIAGRRGSDSPSGRFGEQQ